MNISSLATTILSHHGYQNKRKCLSVYLTFETFSSRGSEQDFENNFHFEFWARDSTPCLVGPSIRPIRLSVHLFVRPSVRRNFE